ncbi:MAG: hypothetical protein JSR77_14120 [Planctomycetes bacterium]|nr:hypothetical protein [Planctomycetota bacterium]
MRTQTLSLQICLVAALGASCLGQERRLYITGLPAGFNDGRVLGLSRDGSVAVGNMSGNNALLRGFKWSVATGRVDIVDPALGSRTELTDVSDDGLSLVGAHCNNSYGSDRRVMFSRSGAPYQNLPILEPYSRGHSDAYISGDATIVSGTCLSATLYGQAFIWTAATGIRGLGFARPGDSRSQVLGMSRDGSTIVGSSESISQGTGTGFIWTEKTGMRAVIGLNGDTDCHCRGANIDGSVVVGDTSANATLWDADRVAHDLGNLPGRLVGYAYAVSGDGKIVVGTSIKTTPIGFIWTAESGMRAASDVLIERGVVIPSGFSILYCYAISGDGSTIAGSGRGTNGIWQGFVAYMGKPCPADFNEDGGVDGGDVQAFLRSWESGDPHADVNYDGGVDGEDMGVFFSSWEAGGC